MNKPQKYQARIVHKDTYSSKVFLFTVQLDTPPTISFTAGQFLSIQVGPSVNRSYSIASAPSRTSTLDLLVDIAPGGPGSTFFSREEVGSTINFIGPMGKFVLEKEEGTIVFLATGTGIAPFRSMLDHLFEKQTENADHFTRNIHVYLGFRYEENIFWHEYFESRKEQFPNFHYEIILSQSPDHWQGKRGYVQQNISPELYTKPDAHFYICGGNHMVKGALEFLREKKVAEDKLHFEPF